MRYLSLESVLGGLFETIREAELWGIRTTGEGNSPIPSSSRIEGGREILEEALFETIGKAELWEIRIAGEGNSPTPSSGTK